MNNKIKENEQQITYFKLENLLKRAYKSKAKISDDPIHEEVNCTIYCGAGFNVGVTATSYEDPDMAGKVCFYVSQQYEDEIGEMNMGEDLEQTIKDLFRMGSDISEMEERPYIDDAEIRKLEDIANGQSLLFENKMEERMKKLNEQKIGLNIGSLMDWYYARDVVEDAGFEFNGNDELLNEAWFDIILGTEVYIEFTEIYRNFTAYHMQVEDSHWIGCSQEEFNKDFKELLEEYKGKNNDE